MEVLDIYGLAFGCTFCDERDDCPFKEIRKIKDCPIPSYCDIFLNNYGF